MIIPLIFCLFAPFPLWLIEIILPFPHLIEELFKFFIVKLTPPKNSWILPLSLGLAFAISETVLYLVNFFALGNFSQLPLRLFTTTTLHLSLFFLQYYFRKSPLSFLSLIMAILIHFSYNQFFNRI